MNSDVINLQNTTAISQAGQPGTGTKLGKTEFLRLLMAQMSHQDPMKPMDNKDFIQQLATFSNLEQLTNMGSQLDSLLKITGASNAANAVSLLGKDVRISGSNFKGPNATVYYQLPDDVPDAKLVVRDKDNNTVKVIDDIDKTAGLHQLDISGLDNQDYTFNIVGKDASGNDISADLSVSEHVDGVNFSDNVPVLITQSGRQVSASNVLEIHEPGTQATAVDTTTTDSGSQQLPNVTQSGVLQLPNVTQSGS